MAILCVSSVKRFVGAGSTRPLGSAVQRWAADRLRGNPAHTKRTAPVERSFCV